MMSFEEEVEMEIAAVACRRSTTVPVKRVKVRVIQQKEWAFANS